MHRKLKWPIVVLSLFVVLIVNARIARAEDKSDGNDSKSVRIDDSKTFSQLELQDTKGAAIQLPESKYRVFCFLGTECPLAKLYGPRLQKIADQFPLDFVQFVGVNSNLQDSPEEIDTYVDRCKLQFPMVHDESQSVADFFLASRTPEVFVVDENDRVVYQGRIDDQYAPGIARAEPTVHDLENALNALSNQAEVPVPKTQSVGCLITRKARISVATNSSSSTTFNGDVLPLLRQHCIECHREGEIGPMVLDDYDEVVGWADMILEVIDQKRMPPWHADPKVGHFVGERHFPNRHRETIAKWIQGGMLEGESIDSTTKKANEQIAAERLARVDGWQFSSDPDVVLEMRNRAFHVPADGVVEYQYFVVDPKWENDRWVKAAQVVPGDRSVVHHCIVFVRPPDGARYNGVGWLGAYVPGQRSVMLPEGNARFVPAGSKLVFQMHYTPNGSETDDITKMGVWFSDASDVTHRVQTQIAIDHDFEIPPGDSNFQVELKEKYFPKGGKMLGITPHMHLRGKSFQIVANYKDDKEKMLLRVPNYDFNWQHWYQFESAIELDDIKSLDMKVAFDNSEDNPFNPDPDEFVSWGDQTWEEMALAFFDVSVPRTPPQIAPVVAAPEKLTKRNQAAEKLADEFFETMDKDGDGIVKREETPMTFRQFAFWQFDKNRDGTIQRDEALTQALKRVKR